MFLGYIDTDMNVFAHWYYHYLSIPADVTAHICMHVNIQYMDICIYVYIIIYVYIYVSVYTHVPQHHHVLGAKMYHKQIFSMMLVLRIFTDAHVEGRISHGPWLFPASSHGGFVCFGTKKSLERSTF